MAYNNKDLKAQFPDLDLTQSTYSDMLKAHENSKSKTHAALKNMQKELQQEKESKVRELQEQFTAIPKSIIIQTLESVKWDVDTAIVPLFTILEEYQRPQEVELIKQYELAQSKLPRPEDKEVKITTVKVEEAKEEVVYENKENPFKVETTTTTSVTAEKEQPQKTGILKASPENVDVGNTIAVEWQIINGTTSSYDWIGLYQIDQPNKQYLTYEWRGAGELNGTLTFKAPATYGTYEFRYIPYGSYNHVAKSNPIQVGPQVNLTATLNDKKINCNWDVKVGNQYSWAWVGLFEKTQTNNKNFITWQYANKVSELTFDAPIKPTEYELRYFVYGYNHVARSNTIKIEGKDTLEAIVKDGETISAKVSIVTLDPYYDSVWIGLYSASENNNRNIKRYKWITERETEVTFRAPESGEYEFRLFANKSYDMKLKSNSIKIEQQLQQ